MRLIKSHFFVVKKEVNFMTKKKIVDASVEDVVVTQAPEIIGEEKPAESETAADNLAEESAENLSAVASDKVSDETEMTEINSEPDVSQDENSGKEPETDKETPKEAVKKSLKRTAKSVVSIDERRTVETDADKANNDLLDLFESLRTGRILTGTIQGVEKTSEESRESVAVLYKGTFKIIIPASEAVTPPEDFRGQNPDDVMRYLLTKRLGAETDYIIKGVDPEAKIAVASRLEAMKSKMKQYYFGTDRDGNNLLSEGICAEARVVSVIRTGIFVDLFGVETFVPIKELSYQRLMDAAGYFQPGQRVLVKILDIDRSDKKDVKATVSVKQAGENPYETALRKYTVGNRYVGTVSMVDVNGVFVALDGGIDCLCSYPKRGRPPRGARVTVRILGINHETNRIWGAITHTANPR